jgi:hypothetical protein
LNVAEAALLGGRSNDDTDGRFAAVGRRVRTTHALPSLGGIDHAVTQHDDALQPDHEPDEQGGDPRRDRGEYRVARPGDARPGEDGPSPAIAAPTVRRPATRIRRRIDSATSMRTD